MNGLSIRARIALATAFAVATFGCHHEAKKPTSEKPAHASRRQSEPPADDAPPTYDILVQRGTYQLQMMTQMQENMFQISRAAWNVDQDGGMIRFESPSGLVATAPVQIIGTYNTVEGTWLWAWDNPSVHPGLAQHASALRELGQQNSLAELTTAKLTCDQEHCWTFVAAITAMTNAQGAYRGMAGDTAVFMTFGTVEMSKSK